MEVDACGGFVLCGLRLLLMSVEDFFDDSAVDLGVFFDSGVDFFGVAMLDELVLLLKC